MAAPADNAWAASYDGVLDQVTVTLENPVFPSGADGWQARAALASSPTVYSYDQSGDPTKTLDPTNDGSGTWNVQIAWTVGGVAQDWSDVKQVVVS
jgi:hypothetical protein